MMDPPLSLKLGVNRPLNLPWTVGDKLDANTDSNDRNYTKYPPS